MPVIHSIKSDYYGVYNSICVGIVDYAALLRSMGVEEYSRWYWRYSPVRYFNSHTQIMLYEYLDENGKSMYLDRMAIFVGTKEINKEWDSRNTDYGRAIGDNRRRQFPLSANFRDIEKWQSSLSPGILVPVWMRECSNLDELIVAHRIAYT